jgi:hypothetical protein
MQNLVPGFPTETSVQGHRAPYNVNPINPPGDPNYPSKTAVKQAFEKNIQMTVHRTDYPIGENIDILTLEDKNMLSLVNSEYFMAKKGEMLWGMGTDLDMDEFQHEGYTQLQLNMVLEVEARMAFKMINNFSASAQIQYEINDFLPEGENFEMNNTVDIVRFAKRMKNTEELKRLKTTRRRRTGALRFSNAWEFYERNAGNLNFILNCLDTESVSKRFNYIGICFTCKRIECEAVEDIIWDLGVEFRGEMLCYLNVFNPKNGMRFTEFWYNVSSTDLTHPVQLYIANSNNSVKDIKEETKKLYKKQDIDVETEEIHVVRGRDLAKCKENRHHYPNDKGFYDGMQRFPFTLDNSEKLEKTRELIINESSHKKQKAVVEVF